MGKNYYQKGSIPHLFLLVLLIVAGVAIYYFKIAPIKSFPQVAVPSKPLTLSLESPSNGSLSVNNKVTVKGKTLPNTTVIFYTEEDQNSVESNNQGSFEGEINLAYGISSLTVTAFSENGEEKSVTLDVVNDVSTALK